MTMSAEERKAWESAGADFRNGPFRRIKRKVKFAYRKWRRHHGDHRI